MMEPSIPRICQPSATILSIPDRSLELLAEAEGNADSFKVAESIAGTSQGLRIDFGDVIGYVRR